MPGDWDLRALANVEVYKQRRWTLLVDLHNLPVERRRFVGVQEHADLAHKREAGKLGESELLDVENRGKLGAPKELTGLVELRKSYSRGSAEHASYWKGNVSRRALVGSFDRIDQFFAVRWKQCANSGAYQRAGCPNNPASGSTRDARAKLAVVAAGDRRADGEASTKSDERADGGLLTAAPSPMAIALDL
jgi:hypothetical protein